MACCEAMWMAGRAQGLLWYHSQKYQIDIIFIYKALNPPHV